MRLSPREEDHLVLHAAGALAQKRLARGLRLNYTEAVALLATQVRFFVCFCCVVHVRLFVLHMAKRSDCVVFIVRRCWSSSAMAAPSRSS